MFTYFYPVILFLTISLKVIQMKTFYAEDIHHDIIYNRKEL